MFGISFSKVLLLVAVVAAIWFGFRWFQRWEKERRERSEREEEGSRLGRDASARSDDRQTEVMTACRICGTYVAQGARSCGRPRCPFPG
ncbi:MAG: hypothetical protein FJX55_17205 [Alphaproteobacteria bacterium]|nr:hypothetical protein [Alphaproteobacteria bacterium]